MHSPGAVLIDCGCCDPEGGAIAVECGAIDSDASIGARERFGLHVAGFGCFGLLLVAKEWQCYVIVW